MADQTRTGALTLSEFLPYRLSVLSNTVSSAIAEMYRSKFGLNIWQWRVMAVLGEAPGLTARDVAGRTAMDKVAVSRAVAALEARGLLQRDVHPEDGRAAHLTLTAQGKNFYTEIVPLALAHEEALLAHLTPSELSFLKRLLDKLAGGASPNRKLW